MVSFPRGPPQRLSGKRRLAETAMDPMSQKYAERNCWIEKSGKNLIWGGKFMQRTSAACRRTWFGFSEIDMPPAQGSLESQSLATGLVCA